MSRKTVAAALAAATAAACYGLEADWLLRRRRQARHEHPRPVAAERRSTYVVLATTTLGDLGAAVWLLRAPRHHLLGDRATAVCLALPGIWAGAALRRWAVTTLGEHHRATVDIRPGQPVVRTGPYRYVRHPSYAGGLLTVACTGLALDHPPAALTLFGCTLAGLLYRIRTEDAALVRAFGASYTAYAATTARLLPRIW